MADVQLSFQDLIDHDIFSCKAYEKPDSKAFFRACQNGQHNEVKDLLLFSPYLVYDFDDVRF